MALKKIWIGEMLYRIVEAMRTDFGISDSGMEIYSASFKNIERLFIQKFGGYYLPKYGVKLILELTEECKCGNFDATMLNRVRKTCQYLQQYYENGKLTYIRYSRLGIKTLNPYFESIVDWYINMEIVRGQLAEKTISSRNQKIRKFLNFIVKAGYEHFNTVPASVIREYIVELAKAQPIGIKSTLPIIRKFCAALAENLIFEQNWSDIMDVKLPDHRVIRTAFTKSETQLLLNAPDKSTSIGKRDYAMMLLAARTGLRGIDIINLKLTDINWYTNEITIIQRKTGKPLGLPLFVDVGNAIAEYILNGRTKVRRKFVFLSKQAPHEKLCDTTTNTIVKKYMKMTGFSKKHSFRKGFHSFRRSIGTQMMEAEIPIELISQVLGHSSVEATKPYLSIDMVHLKECALDLSIIPCLRGELC